MPRRIEFRTLTNEEWKQLDTLSRSKTQPYRLVERAKMVTLACQGQSVELLLLRLNCQRAVIFVYRPEWPVCAGQYFGICYLFFLYVNCSQFLA